MDEKEVKKFEGKSVLIILKNGYKFTATIPLFEGKSFTIEEKYGQKVSIDCDFINLIYEKEVEE